MVETYPVFTCTGRKAQYAIHARLSFTGGEVTTIAQSSSSVDLGSEKTVEIVGGLASGNVSVSSSMSLYSSSGGAAGVSSAISNSVTGYIELRKSDNSTVVGRIGLPVTNPITFSGVRYIYLFVEAAAACDIAPDHYFSSGARTAIVANATCYFNVV